MLDYSKVFETVVIGIAAFAAVGGGIGGLYYAVRSKQVKVLKEEVEVLRQDVSMNKERLADCNSKHDDSTRRIEDLEKKLLESKDIPLQKIAKHMEKTNQSLQLIIDRCP